MRGVNSDELIDLAQLTLEHDWHVRFIELMPVQNQSAWGQDFPSPQDAYFPIAEMLASLRPCSLSPFLLILGAALRTNTASLALPAAWALSHLSVSPSAMSAIACV